MNGATSLPSAAANPRGTYRHGDLRRALIDAGVALARAGGPGAVVLREATRRAGVVPNAAYRHFASRDELLQAVRAAALAAAATSMEVELAALHPASASSPERGKGALNDIAHARAMVRAVGTGYVRFALEQPGLFRTAFQGPDTLSAGPNPDAAGASGMNPLQLLRAALDRLVQAGALPAARRAGAEYVAWSAVHGLAMLIIDGPLQGTPPDHAQALAQQLLDMVERGL